MCVQMCVYVFVCAHVCLCVQCVRIYVCMPMCVQMCVCVGVCMCLCADVCLCARVCVQSLYLSVHVRERVRVRACLRVPVPLTWFYVSPGLPPGHLIPFVGRRQSHRAGLGPCPRPASGERKVVGENPSLPLHYSPCGLLQDSTPPNSPTAESLTRKEV